MRSFTATLIIYQTTTIFGTDDGGLDSILDDLGNYFSRKGFARTEMATKNSVFSPES